jgi:hypothetical protein
VRRRYALHARVDPPPFARRDKLHGVRFAQPAATTSEHVLISR